jgi:hypothetical protein
MSKLALLQIAIATVLFGCLELNVPTNTLHAADGEPRCSDCVGSDLASLRIELKTLSYRVGQPIAVTLILSAGDKGVYLPNNFADFMASCQAGFSAVILTASGTSLSDAKAVGCAGSILHSLNDTALTELHNFVYLRPGEQRVWRTTLSTSDIPAGKYQILGEYLSMAYMIREVGQLPAVNGRMAIGRVQSKPVRIGIDR